MKLVFALGLILILNTPLSFAAEEKLTAGIANTIDASDLNLADPLKVALGSMLESTGSLKVQLVDFTLGAVTADEVIKAFETVGTDLILLVHLDNHSISVLLFSKDRNMEFIMANRPIDNDPSGQITTPFIEARFIEAINQVLEEYNAGKFQPLPGSQVAEYGEDTTDRRANEARTLYRELAQLEKNSWYAGANIGMARFSQMGTSGQLSTVSNVDFGAIGGFRINDRIAVEAGFDVFSHLMFHSDFRYHIPLLNKYVDISVMGGGAMVLSRITENGSSQINDTLARGIVAGPGLAFDVPLLGSTIRAEARYYLGSTSVMVATYGMILNF